MANPVTIYGIKNCDTMMKARGWLDGRGVAYAFNDYRVDGIGRDRLEEWAGKVSWEKLLNRASTTFRALWRRPVASCASCHRCRPCSRCGRRRCMSARSRCANPGIELLRRGCVRRANSP